VAVLMIVAVAGLRGVSTMSRRVPVSLAFLALVTLLTAAHPFIPGAAAQGAPPLPDLIATATFHASEVVPGATIFITVITTNRSTTAGVGPSTTRVYLSADTNVDDGDILVGSVAVPALEPTPNPKDPNFVAHKNTTAIQVTLPTGTGWTYNLLAVADADNAYAESNEGNNVGVSSKPLTPPTTPPGPPPRPDLIATTTFHSSEVVAGATATVTVITTNRSKAVGVGPSTTRVFLSANTIFDGGAILLGSVAVPALDAQPAVKIAGFEPHKNTTAIQVTFPTGPVGTYHLLTISDADSADAESDEGNNLDVSAPLTLFFQDLVVTTVRAPGNTLAGAAIAVRDTVANLGNIQAPPSRTNYYLSHDAVLDASDVLLGSREIPLLDVGASDLGVTPLVIPDNTAPGCYFIIASADAGNAIAERSESNTRARRIQILPVAGGGPLLCTRGDFNGDGKADILWRHSSGLVDMWVMNGPTLVSANTHQYMIDLGWTIQGVGDFNGDGKADILWRHSSGLVDMWLMDGPAIASANTHQYMIDLGWTIQGVGDFNGDGKADILWRHSSGLVDMWLMDGPVIASANTNQHPSDPLGWTIHGVGDFDGDGKDDILWRHQSGLVEIWFMDGPILLSTGTQYPFDLSWTIQGVGDFNGDGNEDILWRNESSGSVDIWFMDGERISDISPPYSIDLGWTIQ
jgi:hypothetical protein